MTREEVVEINKQILEVLAEILKNNNTEGVKGDFGGLFNPLKGIPEMNDMVRELIKLSQKEEEAELSEEEVKRQRDLIARLDNFGKKNDVLETLEGEEKLWNQCSEILERILSYKINDNDVSKKIKFGGLRKYVRKVVDEHKRNELPVLVLDLEYMDGIVKHLVDEYNALANGTTVNDKKIVESIETIYKSIKVGIPREYNDAYVKERVYSYFYKVLVSTTTTTSI